MTSDWLNPIVIKELRQGLKSRVFTGSFLALQGLMVCSMLMYMAVGADRQEMQFANGFFWFMLGILVIFVVPGRAFQAIHKEQENHTLEMVFLTRMSSWNIAFGKWLALIIQLWLLVAAVLPYLVMRYFLGAVNVTEDLITLGVMILTGMLLTSAGIGFSGWKSKLLRGLLMGGVFMSFYILPVTLFGITRSGAMRFISNPVFVWVMGLIGVALLMAFLIEYGASLIAPPAENHARRKRILALVILGWYITVLAVEQAMTFVFLGLIFILPICIDALCEPFHLIPSLYRHRCRGGWLGAIFRPLFYPGWPSGFLFVVFIMAVLSTFVILFGPDDTRVILFLISLIGTLLLPLAIMVAVRPSAANLMPGYLGIQFVMLIIAFILVVMKMAVGSRIDFLLSLLPVSALMMSFSKQTGEEYFIASVAITAISMLVILIRMAVPWRRMLAAEKTEAG